MSRKTERLIRELASLFVQYSLSDWQPLLSELSQTGSNRGLAEAIEAQLEAAAKRARSLKSRGKGATKTASKRRIAKRGGALAQLDLFRDALIARRILPTSNDLRMAAEAIGIKDDLPADRRDSIRRIVDHLTGLPKQPLSLALDKLARAQREAKSDQGAEFERWAALIMRSSPTP